MNNPLTLSYSELENTELIKKSLDGDRHALDALIKLHQSFIYNVAWKMAYDENDAMDLTQEVLIKAITKLALFKGKSSFRTWLYRIITNQFLQTKRREKENEFPSFSNLDERLNAVPDGQLTPDEEIEHKEYTKEINVRCMSGMLMCLSREQRLIYVLGEMFEIDHNVGSEIFEISKQNYRKKLSRARTELHNFMEFRCGLVNTKNSCRCQKKAKTLKEKGILTKDNFVFNVGYKNKIAEYVETTYAKRKDVVDEKYVDFYRNHPAKQEFGAETVISEIVNDKELQKLFSLKKD